MPPKAFGALTRSGSAAVALTWAALRLAMSKKHRRFIKNRECRDDNASTTEDWAHLGTAPDASTVAAVCDRRSLYP